MDAGLRRYLVYPLDFDMRATTLTTEIQETWEPQVKELWTENRANTIAGLKVELGEGSIEMKVKNFADLGGIPFSIVSYHNVLFHQARYAFYHGFYFPALTAACALGERMLNHLVLDLREEFRATPEYQGVYRKKSFNDWGKAIDVLTAWNVFQADSVAREFAALAALRNKSLHFNEETYSSLRDDALQALKHLAEIIRVQFGFASGQRWMLPGTAGQFFIRKESENDPFLRRYYLPQCPLVGPLFAINFAPDGVLFFDRANYEGEGVSDGEFAARFNGRDPKDVVPTSLPAADDIVVWKRARG